MDKDRVHTRAAYKLIYVLYPRGLILFVDHRYNVQMSNFFRCEGFVQVLHTRKNQDHLGLQRRE